MHDNKTQPNPLTDPLVPAIGAYALVTAVSIGLFPALTEQPRSIKELSDKLSLSSTGLERLAAVLASLGYLNSNEGIYELTEVSRMAFLPKSPYRLRYWNEFCGIQLRAVSMMKEALVADRKVDLYDIMTDDQEFITHQRAMAETAAPAAQWIAEQMNLAPGSIQMLDVGGSHGLYSAAICRQNPPLVSDVLELPAIIPHARAVARDYGSDKYITYLSGDIETYELSKIYDLVFLGNIIHHLTQERVQTVLNKIAKNTAPKGHIVIWDLSESRDSDNFINACFSLFFHITSGAQCYSAAEIAAMLKASGFDRIQVIHTPQTSTHVLYTAWKR